MLLSFSIDSMLSPYILFLTKNSLINDRFFSARSWERFFCCSSLTSTSECTLCTWYWNDAEASKENCDVTPWTTFHHHSPYDWLAYRENHTRDDLTVIQRHTKKIVYRSMRVGCIELLLHRR